MHSVPLFDSFDPTRFPLPVDAPDLEFPNPGGGDVTPGTPMTFLENESVVHFLRFICCHSGYLATLVRREPETVAAILTEGPDVAIDRCLSALPDLDAEDLSEKDFLSGLRRAKRQVALTVAFADILEVWPLSRVTETLADLAESALERSVRRALRQWRGVPGTDGYTILGMGKLGSRELNYSSDIDLIVLYDAERLAPADPDRLRQDLVRVTRQVMRFMDERTGDGYVFRTDLRLRPDPSATPLALSVRAAESYYESVGQNWERAAMIKARPVAGDRALGKEFLTHIRPFVWRKYLDFAAIQDIHSIKRQINAHRGGASIAVDGHNIKIGRGGIREIEFYAQTQQLIWGGRQPDLRVKATCAALDQLAVHGHAEPETVRELKNAYEFLRRLEHRLQMVADQQTQTVPDTEDEVAAIARFMGYGETDEFRRALRSHLETVAGHYARLFEEAPDLGGGGSLVFTGTEDDPDTLQTLAEMGFEQPSHIAGRIRVWHHGRYRATRSVRSRQILTELMPRLLQAFADTANPDDAFLRFDSFLSGLPSGVQLFSLFQMHPTLLDLLSEILGSAPRLAEVLARKPILLDSVISEDFYEPLPLEREPDEELAAALELAQDFQDVLDAVRRWTNDRKFRVGVHFLRGLADGDRVGAALSAVAEAALSAILPPAEDEFADAHGRVTGAGLAIVAFGKLGGGELLPMSDMDLVFVYDADPDIEESDGPKPIGPQVYFLRLCQRLVTAITTETGEGRLYEVDGRLRPSGNAGPLATQFEGFDKYYRVPDGEAWTWEHMALTRARTVYGTADLRAKLEKSIHNALIQKRDPAKLFIDVDDMRERIAREFAPKTAWDVKYRRGGLVDVEFIAQALQLAHAAEKPEVLSPNTALALERLHDAGCLPKDAFEDLRSALALWRGMQAAIRLTAASGRFDAENAPEGQKRVLARAAGVDQFDDLAPLMERAADRVSRHYAALIADPASAYREERQENPA
ncbi:MAG: bifunctional [glutamine synthetase] adenylyltransferase/[glutamine synthetase]-adenylyl-L-tyrosine phosphorylase [Alphaproteobacteria bacterium]|nr:bifunctional [glutamine synthetase] adenylyltransferase/[glutamine synthetase]-adenylyl-L-tyrosine phosphorylase [Alphaproteobacteria bacterium]